MTPPRFQFTIRGFLWATFWAAMSMAAWTLLFSKAVQARPHLMLPIGFFLIVSPFIMAGALFGRTVKGFQWGVVFIYATVALVAAIIAVVSLLVPWFTAGI